MMQAGFTWGDGGQWFSGLATFAAVGLAWFFGNREWKRLTKRSSLVIVGPSANPRDCISAPVRPQPQQMVTEHGAVFEVERELVPSHQVRIPIEARNQDAREVEVFAESLEVQRDGGRWEAVDGWIPANLVWGAGYTGSYPVIPHGSRRWCNLFHIPKPGERDRLNGEHLVGHEKKPLLSFDVAVKSFAGNHLHPPGTYRLTLVVTAANADPVREVRAFTLASEWHDALSDMLKYSLTFH